MDKYLGTKEVAALVRADLKAQLPQWKFSVTYESFSMGSSIHVRLMSGPEEAVAEGPQYGQLNRYTFAHPDSRYPLRNNGVDLTQAGWDVMSKANEVVSKYHWDESEPQTDYFCCNFYYHLCIGKWNRDYVVKGESK